MLQFLLDFVWFGNITFVYSSFAFFLGLFAIFGITRMTFDHGDLDVTPEPINTIQPNKNSVAIGKISSPDPFIWNDTEYAYFLNKETKECFPSNQILTLEDDSGTIPIRVANASIDHDDTDPDNDTICGLAQNSTVFVRGFVNSDGEFTSTYSTRSTAKKTTYAVDDAVEIQKTSFHEKAKASLLNIPRVIAFSLIVFMSYPIYKYYSVWQDEIQSPIVDTFESAYAFRLYLEDGHVFIPTTMGFYSCKVGEVITKPARSLNVGCGETPEEYYIENKSLKDQMWSNTTSILGTLFILFLIFGPYNPTTSKK